VEHYDGRSLPDIDVGQAQIPDCPVAGLESEVREPLESLFGRAKDATNWMRRSTVSPKSELHDPPPDRRLAVQRQYASEQLARETGEAQREALVEIWGHGGRDYLSAARS
jgi:hypothetical protein